jgi:hypothetical protein
VVIHRIRQRNRLTIERINTVDYASDLYKREELLSKQITAETPKSAA